MVTAKLQKTLEKIKKEKEIYIFITKNKNYVHFNAQVLRYLIKKLKLIGIYVTLTTPHSTLLSHLKKENVNTSKIFFIDGTSSQEGLKVTASNCTCIQSPNSLTELSLVITELANTGKFDFLFFDSISTLLVYNDLSTTQKFTQYIIGKLKAKSMCGGIILAVEDEKTKQIIPTLSQFCDGCVNI